MGSSGQRVRIAVPAAADGEQDLWPERDTVQLLPGLVPGLLLLAQVRAHRLEETVRFADTVLDVLCKEHFQVPGDVKEAREHSEAGRTAAKLGHACGEIEVTELSHTHTSSGPNM